jgi:hypothetical protein
MSTELRQLFHTAAAEPGAMPNVDAIVTRVRRRRRRRVALSASTAIVAALVAGATLWPGNQQARVAVGSAASSCPKAPAPDISRYGPLYLPPGYKGVAPPGGETQDPAVGVTNAQTFENFFQFRLKLEVRRLSVVGSFRKSAEATARRISRGRTSSFVLPCKGRVSVWTDDADRGPIAPESARRITYLVLRLDPDTEAVLKAEPPTPDVVAPPVTQLVKMAQSVALR